MRRPIFIEADPGIDDLDDTVRPLLGQQLESPTHPVDRREPRASGVVPVHRTKLVEVGARPRESRQQDIGQEAEEIDRTTARLRGRKALGDVTKYFGRHSWEPAHERRRKMLTQNAVALGPGLSHPSADLSQVSS